MRIEQLYPFPKEDFAAALAPYPGAAQIIWCQEEAQNQGAWDQIKHRFHYLIEDGQGSITWAGRPPPRPPWGTGRCTWSSRSA
jgi:2-oxoglutarate dehydrogenase E1 component